MTLLTTSVVWSANVCGSSCCCTLLGLSKLQQKSFKNIEAALKEKIELEEWKKNNPDIVNKLDKLNSYGLPFYKPFISETAFSALTEEDSEFIRKVNTKLLLSDLKHLDILDDLLDYDPKDIYKSIRDHVLVKGKYLSGKQKEFIEKEYETLLKKRNEVTIAISNGYEFKEYLKEDGYSFNPRKKEWSKTVPSRYADDEQEKLKAIGIDSSSVQRRKATW